MTTITYRRASPEDVDRLRDLHIAAYSEFANSLPADGWATLSASLHDRDKLMNVFAISRAYVGEAAGQLVGMAFLVGSGNPTPVYPAEWCYIRMVGVHPLYRGKGVGKQLTSMCITGAREAGEKTIGLHTSEVMDAARHIYEHMGFRVEREIDQLFGVRYWLYRMDL